MKRQEATINCKVAVHDIKRRDLGLRLKIPDCNGSVPMFYLRLGCQVSRDNIGDCNGFGEEHYSAL